LHREGGRAYFNEYKRKYQLKKRKKTAKGKQVRLDGNGPRTGRMQDWEIGTAASNRRPQPAPTSIPTSN